MQINSQKKFLSNARKHAFAFDDVAFGPGKMKRKRELMPSTDYNSLMC